MISRKMATTLLVALATFVLSVEGVASPGIAPSTSQDVDAVLADAVLGEMNRWHDHGDPAGSRIFYTNVDWHSSIEAYWAVFRLANKTGKYLDQAKILASRFTPENLAHEMKLVKTVNYTDHYGFAWFLRLTIEFNKWAVANQISEPNRLSAIAEYISMDLQSEYSNNGVNVHATDYLDQAWWLIHLYDYLSYFGKSGLDKIKTLIKQNYLARPNMTFSQDDPAAFYSDFGNWVYLVARTQTPDTFANFAGDSLITDDDLKRISQRTKDSSSGYAASYLWAIKAALSALKGTNSAAIASLENALPIVRQMVLRDLNVLIQGQDPVGNHYAYQFIVYGVTEEATYTQKCCYLPKARKLNGSQPFSAQAAAAKPIARR